MKDEMTCRVKISNIYQIELLSDLSKESEVDIELVNDKTMCPTCWKRGTHEIPLQEYRYCVRCGENYIPRPMVCIHEVTQHQKDLEKMFEERYNNNWK